jgi:hypothetical protein
MAQPVSTTLFGGLIGFRIPGLNILSLILFWKIEYLVSPTACSQIRVCLQGRGRRTTSNKRPQIPVIFATQEWILALLFPCGATKATCVAIWDIWEFKIWYQWVLTKSMVDERFLVLNPVLTFWTAIIQKVL